MQGFKIKTT